MNAGYASWCGNTQGRAVAKKRPTDRKLAADDRVPIPANLRPRPALHYELDKKPERRVLWVLCSLTPGLNYLTKGL